MPQSTFSLNRRACWLLAAVLALVAIATEQIHLGLGTLIVASTTIEVLTWAGAFGAGIGDDDR